MGYEWPGNVRELENCIERMVIMTRRRILLPEDLPLQLQPAADDSPEASLRPPQPSRRRLAAPGAAVPTLRAMEREQVVKALTQSGGIQARAAALLGITPRQFAYRLRKYGIVRGFQVDGAPLGREA
jgi:transcriptional regulator with GAF, ATPase, and Fis domain